MTEDLSGVSDKRATELVRIKELARAACLWIGHYRTLESDDGGGTWQRNPVGQLWEAINDGQ